MLRRRRKRRRIACVMRKKKICNVRIRDLTLINTSIGVSESIIGTLFGELRAQKDLRARFLMIARMTQIRIGDCKGEMTQARDERPHRRKRFSRLASARKRLSRLLGLEETEQYVY